MSPELPPHHLPSDPPEVYLVGLVFPTRPLDLHPDSDLVAQGSSGDLSAVGSPGSGADDSHSGPLAEGSWWPKTWTEACGLERTPTGLQSLEQTGPLGLAWWIWW